MTSIKKSDNSRDTERLDWVLHQLSHFGHGALNRALVNARQRTPYDRRTIDLAMGLTVEERAWHCPQCGENTNSLYTCDWPEKELPETWYFPIMCFSCWAPIKAKSPGLEIKRLEL